MSKPNYSKDDLANLGNDYVERKVIEHYRIDRLADANSNVLTYEVLDNDKRYPHPPTHYRITYHLKSFVGLQEDLSPVVGTEHIMELKIHSRYPEFPIDAKLITDTWHPNTKPVKDGGYICTNTANFGSLFPIDQLIVRIGEILQYKKYMAEDRSPWPENEKAAKWVREYAEPQDIVSNKKNVFTDEYSWAQFFDIGYPEVDPLTASQETDLLENEDEIIFETSIYGESAEPNEAPNDQPIVNEEEEKTDDGEDIIFL